jgi:hypothetical protein
MCQGVDWVDHIIKFGREVVVGDCTAIQSWHSSKIIQVWELIVREARVGRRTGFTITW